jgi:hypothetical protein
MGVMVIKLDIEICVIGKSGTKKGKEKEWMVRRRGMVAVRFCGTCVCLGEFLLL